ncbi:NAD(P)-binding protein [Rhizophagus irregularis]|uniref:NAD(P)-binding protein n=1 Tax=Rhizophagus irregularis TaxID=588596 RepID=A0A2N1MVD2_9GLOM|nr:NAD(P)-binding protein [Rhizophagus irregularis]
MKALILRKGDEKENNNFKHPAVVSEIPLPALNPIMMIDVWIRKDAYLGLQFNSVLGSDGVGIVEKTSRDESSHLVGQQVIINPGSGWEKDPKGLKPNLEFLDWTLAEYIVVPRAEIFPVPDHLSVAEAAALPLAGLTAFRATFTKANVQPGENVLITGIGGGVALIALSFISSIGANAYITSSDESKIKKAIELGAKGGVNYKEDDWPKKLKALLPNDRPFLDSVIDSAGGEIVSQTTKLLRPGGIIACYGMTSSYGKASYPSTTFTVPAMMDNIELKGSTMGSRDEFKRMVNFVKEKKIKPVIGGIWHGLENAPEVFEIMNKGKQFGKLVIEIN